MRQHKNIELCRLERLITAAGMGTVWLGGMPMDQETMVITAFPLARIVEDTVLCSRTLENCHVHA